MTAVPSAVPATRLGSVVRTHLLDRLVDCDVPLVLLVAPPGYGKTTLLAQWAERDARPSAWISLRTDGAEVASFAAELESRYVRSGARGPRRRPPLVVVDDVEAHGDTDALRLVARLVDALPAGSTLAVAGRAEPELPLARLRAEGRLLELGVEELALTRAEAHTLLREAGADLPDAQVAELQRRTEGWPSGLYLAALGLADGGSVEGFHGDDCFVADYLREEHLTELAPGDLRFLLRTSILEQLSGPLCDAVLERHDSARRLAELERGEHFLVPVDRRHEWFRCHRLLREFLLSELERRDPTIVPRLYERAADWSEANGAGAAAVEYAAAGGDTERAARLAARHALQAYHDGRTATLERWLRLLEGSPSVADQPELCAIGAWLHAVRGRPESADRWADAAESDGGDGPWLATLRALRCRDGVAHMLLDAEAAVGALPAASPWRPAALLACGVAQLLDADLVSSETTLADAVDAAAAAGSADLLVVALAERSLLAAARGAYTDADAFADEARVAAAGRDLGADMTHALQHAVSARAALRRGDSAGARVELAKAERLRPLLTHAVPWLSVQTLLELAHAAIGLADAGAARDLVNDALQILRHRPGLDALAEAAAELRRQVVAFDEPDGRWAASLTPAELRLLPLLATHLSFREIGEHLYVSRNTVKTQAISVYRKFGVSSRSEAIARAVDLGLVDGATRSAFTPIGR